MIEISPHGHLALVLVLAAALTCLLTAVVVLRFADDRRPWRRVWLGGLSVGLICAVASGAFWSSRHAGTGTQTDWGWPRKIYGRWVSWETTERNEGIRWQGIAENTVFYGAAALLAYSIVLTASRRD